MRELKVFIEISGEQRYVGKITGETYLDAGFHYDAEYMQSSWGKPVSISLPFQDETFSAGATRNFFEGLLPEGFSRKAVAEWIKADENDYLTILSVLGRECLGAIKVTGDRDTLADSAYVKLSFDQVRELAEEGASKSSEILIKTHLSLAGATGKVGLYYDADNDSWYLPKGDAPSTHIVKQSHVRLKRVVLNEQLCLLAAKKQGIDVSDTFIINIGSGRDEEILFATSRYDRLLDSGKSIDGLPVPDRLHQEDFAQAMGIASSDKYEKSEKGYLAGMFDTIRANCKDPISEQKKLWKRICFNFLIGNTDCHIKNYSLLYNKSLGGISLAPAYDIISTRVYRLTNEMSFYIGGELDIEKMDRSSFARASHEAGMAERMAVNILDDMADSFEAALEEASEEIREAGFNDVSDLKERILSCGGYANLS